MKLDISADDLEAMLDAWRQSADLASAMTDQFRIMMMANRRQILENLLQTGSGWQQLLRCARPVTPDDDAEYQRIRTSLDVFVAWAAAELDLLDQLRDADA
ncbi:MAG TPA: hypothetical protein VIM12_02875 [Noviherbaspirillum sp.]|jgi:hypothetical protein|uniref:hypothetical protein n=1 Tax=Noviherbaspirillum sp. TaxID=1926288 RepID=UPI002F9552A9